MAIQTGGYGVQVMPQLAAIDPRMYAPDPSRILQGAGQGLQFLGQIDQMKAFRAQQAEQDQTRDARIANTKALSDLAVLHAQEERAITDQKTAAALAHLGLATEQDKGALASLPAERAFADLKRGFESTRIGLEGLNLGPDNDLRQKQRGFDTKKLALEDLTLGTDKKRSEDAIDAKTELDRAEAEFRRAEAIRAKAVAKAAELGKPPKDIAGQEFDKKVGELAALTGKQPEQLQKLYESGAVNSRNVPVATELAALGELLKKPEFYLDPYKTITPELRAWLGHDVVQAIANKSGVVAPGNIDLETRPVVKNKDGTVSTVKSVSIGTPQGEVLIPTISPDGKQLTNEQAVELFKQTGQHLGIYATPEAATQAAKEISAEQGKRLESTKEDKSPPKIKIDAKGNIERPEGEAKAKDKGITAGEVATGAGLTALTVASSPTATKALAGLGGKIAKVGSRIWEGKDAAGRFAGGALKTAPQRGLRALGEMGVRGLSLPAAAAYESNNLIGKALSGNDTGDMTAIEGMAAASSTPTDRENQHEAKFDELSHRINTTIRSGNLNDERKRAELERLIKEREIVWTALQNEQHLQDFSQGHSMALGF